MKIKETPDEEKNRCVYLEVRHIRSEKVHKVTFLFMNKCFFQVWNDKASSLLFPKASEIVCQKKN